MNLLKQFDGTIDNSGKTLLLDHHMGVGDSLWRTCLHRELKRRNPNMKLYVSSMGNYWKDIYKTNLYIDKLVDKIGNPPYINGVDYYVSDQKCCFDKETEIYTNQGWKLFSELDKTETILSLNPETFNLEFLKPVDYIKYLYSGNMFHIKSKKFDMLMTPNHKIFGKVACTKKDNWGFVEVQNLPNRFSIPRYCNWQGEDSDYFQVENIKYDIIPFIKFLAIYLSDGSVRKRGNSYSINIRQTDKNGIEIIKQVLYELGLKMRFNDWGNFYCTDDILGKYLYKFGKSYEKYIPKEIKNLPSDKLRIFLDTYVNFDGHIGETKNSFNTSIKSPNWYSTSSKKLANDLGEIILKVGNVPSYAKKKKDSKIKFGDNEYSINYDNWKITECTNSKLFDCWKEKHINMIKYNDYVYCVELPKNHILYVRRNGKCSWSGNCHVISDYARKMDALDALEIWSGLEIRDKSYVYEVLPEESEWADKFLSKYERPIIGIQLKSSTWVRTWPPEEVTRLIKMLRYNGCTVIVIDNGKFGFKDEGIINLAGGYNIREVAAIVQKLDLLVTPDSGILHFGAHFRIPVVAIFGGSDPSCRLKYYSTVYPISKAKEICELYPCWSHAYICPKGNIPSPCLSVIKAEEVFELVRQIL